MDLILVFNDENLSHLMSRIDLFISQHFFYGFTFKTRNESNRKTAQRGIGNPENNEQIQGKFLDDFFVTIYFFHI